MPRDEIRRQALARDLSRRFSLLGLDELRVLDAATLELELGQQRHGELELRTGAPRDHFGPEVAGSAVFQLSCAVIVTDCKRAIAREHARAELAGLIDREVTGAQARLAADDELMARAAAGGPFWGVGKPVVQEGEIRGLDLNECGPVKLTKRSPADRERYIRERGAACGFEPAAIDAMVEFGADEFGGEG